MSEGNIYFKISDVAPQRVHRVSFVQEHVLVEPALGLFGGGGGLLVEVFDLVVQGEQGDLVGVGDGLLSLSPAL